MKRTFILGFLMLFCFYTVFAQATDEQIRQAANTLGVPYADLRQFVQSYYHSNTASNVIVVDADTFRQEYTANQVRADNQYKGKTLRIAGVVHRIESNYLYLRGGSSLIYVRFRITELQKIANLDIGQTVAFIGICDGMTSSSSHPVISDAVLVVN